MADPNDWNAGVIEEFRTNAGKVGGPFEGAPLLLLNTTGAKSGATRTNPLMYLADGERYVVFASKGGAPADPHWYLNIVANPEASIEVGTETIPVSAVVIEGPEHDRLYDEQATRFPQFREYQDGTERLIPVVALEPTT
jgi:deazaflavin-dependent oxidoreductase (nitroreductase family)